MAPGDEDVHHIIQNESVEESREKGADLSTSKLQLKKKKLESTRRRTKTGCLTCRQRRVKCDETKPTCRNCDKSRRPCAGYQPVPVQRQQQGSAPTQVDPFYQFQTPPDISPSMHIQFSPSSSAPSLQGIASPFSQAQQHDSFTIAHSSAYNHAGSGWPYPTDYGFFNDAAHCSPEQGSWVSGLMPSSQPFAYGMHATMYSPYPGRQTPQPPGLDTAHLQNDALSRSASSRSLQQDHSTTHTNIGKFSSRGERSEIASVTSSQPSLLSTYDSAKHQGYFDHAPAPTHVHSVPEHDQDDPNDPYDIDSNDDTDGQSALVNFRSTRSLILDERMAYLLGHFCNILRPCISIFERPLVHDGSSTFAERLPQLALSNRGLLHGIMAVSALHLAVLHRTSEVVPLKHFVIASRKLNRLLATPSKRHKVETLSLCLLLAFYSVMLGDHAKWMMHLKGCSAFLMEHDFAGMAGRMGQPRATSKRDPQDLRSECRSNTWNGPASAAGQSQPLLSGQDCHIDGALIGKLTGLDIDYAKQAQPSDDGGKSQGLPNGHVIDDWRTRMDLLFWYIKMDIFQSTLSGDRLLLPYEKWKNFPPRGKIGSVESVFATMDHLWLVLGRLADFGAKDRVRKQLKITALGGHWLPDPVYFGQPQVPTQAERQVSKDRANSNSQTSHLPSANEGRTRAPKASSNAPKPKRGPPMFYGMMPPPKIPPSMLSEFHIMDIELQRSKTPDMPKATKSDDMDLEEQTQQALTEHNAIAEALEIWKEALNQEFDAHQSLPSHTNSPFTPILRFSDPTIACMWAFYHFGRILLRRYHPASPPAMMMSAAVNASFTNQDSQMIGRINAGLLETQAELAKAGSMNPTLVAALQEITFPLMFAGVQYRDPVQRTWTIDNLVDVARDSGWNTAFSVASAMESAWTAQGGYERTLARRNPHVAKKYDADLSTSGDMGMTPAEQHESRFDSHDRRLIDRFSDLRAYWAIGVISTSDDIEKMLSQVHISHDPRRESSGGKQMA